VMNQGKIIETGTHRELLDKGGFYAELYNSQFTGSNIETEETANATEYRGRRTKSA
jgi:ATP-binding cassette, subfamily B, multidrug efflux pump